MTRRSARGQNLPIDEVDILNSLYGFALFARAKTLYQAGWTLRSIGEAFDPPRARSTVRYWINTPQPIAGFQGDTFNPYTVPVPTLMTAENKQTKPRRALTNLEYSTIAHLAPTARKYRATMNQGHPSARANTELTELCVRLHHDDRVTIRDLADAAGVSYRAMARRVS